MPTPCVICGTEVPNAAFRIERFASAGNLVVDVFCRRCFEYTEYFRKQWRRVIREDEYAELGKTLKTLEHQVNRLVESFGIPINEVRDFVRGLYDD